MLRSTLALTAIAIATSASAADRPAISLTRLDCGSALIKDFNSFFSDTLEYPSGPRRITDSCYVIRHSRDILLWDTGFPAALKGKPMDMGALIASIDRTIPEQLAVMGLKPSDITIVGISHMHGDHTGQAVDFPAAKLLIGKADFDLTKGPKDPFGPWRGAGAKVQTMHGGDIDVFGDGSVIALNMPGHTPDHMSLLVRLASGNVLLTGDLYHATEARQMRGVPPFNTSRADTLASIDRFERLAKHYNAKVVIQHEPRDIAKLPAFPASLK
ncbi:MAG: N-acyl homoserine lactonase family protein [Sphingomicrobium sp.]|nr:N-acyl homoserine lactonase family protein [Sphingomonadales bacterium]